ncbi:MAG: TlyA family RNA methyltransferase [Desulfobulbaceae bacterium]|nr:TlyA family RNA methyltransferase [Desulfobulbaceae bacterium]
MKIRLDQHLVDTKFASDLVIARAMIGAGEVYVNDTISDKAGTLISHLAEIRIKTRCPYVSRGGLKLAKGLAHFEFDVSDRVCIDIGASTGGFTDCLLQNGAKKVYAIDVAYGQLAWKLRQDARVVVLERHNARKITPEDIEHEEIHLAVMDVSFISLTKIIPAIIPIFPGKINIISLIKPQFELPKDDIGPGGVVVEPKLHDKAILKIEDFALKANLISKGVTESPIRGPKGNTEFLIHITSS